MVESVAREYGQVARNLGVEPELLVNLHRAGQLPAIKAGRRASILIADRDLVTVLRRCLMVRAAKQLNLNQSLEPVTAQAECLSEAILIYLEERYGFGLLLETAQQVIDKLSPRRDSWRNPSASRDRTATQEKIAIEMITSTLPRRFSGSDGSEAIREITPLANAA